MLPSLNLYYDLTQHHRIRFALARVMARPRMDDMRANLVPGFNGSGLLGLGPSEPSAVRAGGHGQPVVGERRQSQA